MFKQLIRSILPIVALLLIATVILFTTLVYNTHAAGTSTHQTKHPIHVVQQTATPTLTGGGVQPNIFLRP